MRWIITIINADSAFQWKEQNALGLCPRGLAGSGAKKPVGQLRCFRALLFSLHSDLRPNHTMQDFVFCFSEKEPTCHCSEVSLTQVADLEPVSCGSWIYRKSWQCVVTIPTISILTLMSNPTPGERAELKELIFVKILVQGQAWRKHLINVSHFFFLIDNGHLSLF